MEKGDGPIKCGCLGNFLEGGCNQTCYPSTIER